MRRRRNRKMKMKKKKIEEEEEEEEKNTKMRLERIVIKGSSRSRGKRIREGPFDRELSGLDEIRLFVTFVLTFLFIRDILHSERGRARIYARA